jgi:hypothetical protein
MKPPRSGFLGKYIMAKGLNDSRPPLLRAYQSLSPERQGATQGDCRSMSRLALVPLAFLLISRTQVDFRREEKKMKRITTSLAASEPETAIRGLQRKREGVTDRGARGLVNRLAGLVLWMLVVGGTGAGGARLSAKTRRKLRGLRLSGGPARYRRRTDQRPRAGCWSVRRASRLRIYYRWRPHLHR